MENPALTPLVVIVLSIAVPPIVSLLKSAFDRPLFNVAVALGVSFVAAAASLVIDSGGLGALTDGPRVLAFLGSVFTLSHVVYRTYFVGTPLNKRLEAAIWGTPPAPAE